MDFLNNKCDDANCDKSNNELDCLKCALISFFVQINDINPRKISNCTERQVTKPGEFWI